MCLIIARAASGSLETVVAPHHARPRGPEPAIVAVQARPSGRGQSSGAGRVRTAGIRRGWSLILPAEIIAPPAATNTRLRERYRTARHGASVWRTPRFGSVGRARIDSIKGSTHPFCPGRTERGGPIPDATPLGITGFLLPKVDPSKERRRDSRYGWEPMLRTMISKARRKNRQTFIVGLTRVPHSIRKTFRLNDLAT
jgi:hypothetical protein